MMPNRNTLRIKPRNWNIKELTRMLQMLRHRDTYQWYRPASNFVTLYSMSINTAVTHSSAMSPGKPFMLDFLRAGNK
jgi:hypothetical protein